MFSKVLILSAFVAIASAGVVAPVGYASPALGYASPIARTYAPSLGYARAAYAPALGYARSAYAAPALGYARAAYAPAAYAAPVATYAHAPVATYAAGVPAIAKAVVPAEYDAHPQYNYAYSVSDALTGDNKHQEESRDGDVVKGSYSLVESDGTRRIVDYTADPINGFNAVVHKEGVAVQKAVVAAPAYAAPIARAYAPAAYAAPIARAYASPAYGYASPAYARAAYIH